MKNQIAIFTTLLLVLPTAQAEDFTENCTEIYDPATDSYYSECYFVPVEHYFSTSTTYNMSGTTNVYLDGLLQEGLSETVTGMLTTTNWYDDWTMESGEDITLELNSTMIFSSYTWSQGIYSQNGAPDLATDYFFEEMINTEGASITIDNPTLWDFLFISGPPSALTLDGDNNGISGIEITDTFWPNNTVVEIQLQAVPLPAAFWLFGSGLVGLLGLRFRRK